jgi:hypothetical protein
MGEALAEADRERRLWAASPLFRAVAPVLGELEWAGFPGLDALNRCSLARCCRAAGHPLHFVPADPRAGAAAYERSVYRHGKLGMRPGSWHDLFNALVWLSFPLAKTALNRVHVEQIEGAGGMAPGSGRRGLRRDRATLFDESGVILAASDALVPGLLRAGEWQRLFVEQRSRLASCADFLVFGHALLEKGLRPYKSMTGWVLVVPVVDDYFALSLAQRLSRLDEALARLIGQTDLLAVASPLSPLPVLGIPGWDEGNGFPDFYDDRAVFRARGDKLRAKAADSHTIVS